MTEIYLWSGEYLTLEDRNLQSSQNSRIEDNVTKIVKVSNPSIEVFEPEFSINVGIGIIVCPGGGYQILAIDLEGYEIAQWLNNLGYTAFVLKYSVPNVQNAALKDLQRAIQLIRSNSINLIHNPKVLGVIGFSAGANLCVRSSAIFNIKADGKLKGIDKFSIRLDFALLIYPAYLDKGERRSLTSGIFIDKDTPPMFVFGTSDDVHGNSSLILTKALRDSKVPVELHFLPKGGHGYGLRKGNIAAETWPNLAEVWLKNILRIKKKSKMKNYNVNCIDKNQLEITGKGDNLNWENALVLTDFVSAWDEEIPKKIEFKALWDTENLFFCFTVYDNEVHIDKKDDSLDSIGNSDRVELFFRTNETLNPYYCLEIDPAPRIMDFIAYPNKNFDFKWKWPENDISVKSHINCNSFTVEGAISLASLRKLNLIKNNTIETGIFRAKFNKQENSTFEPTWISWVDPQTKTPNFHVASSFGVLSLIE